MGGSFYLLRPIANKEEIINAIREDRYLFAKELIDAIEHPKGIHIGTRSNGTFYFVPDHQKYFTNREELVEFLKSGQIRYDDGSTLTIENFINNHCPQFM